MVAALATMAADNENSVHDYLTVENRSAPVE